MKKFAIIIIVTAVCLTVSGQQITQLNNRYRSYDELEKKQDSNSSYADNGQDRNSGSLQKYDPLTGKIMVISNDMPSDENDPNRINQQNVEENKSISLLKTLLMQENIDEGIFNNSIK